MRIFRAKLEANRKSNQSPVDRKCRIKQDVDWPAGVSETATIEVENRKKKKGKPIRLLEARPDR